MVLEEKPVENRPHWCRWRQRKNNIKMDQRRVIGGYGLDSSGSGERSV